MIWFEIRFIHSCHYNQIVFTPCCEKKKQAENYWFESCSELYTDFQVLSKKDMMYQSYAKQNFKKIFCNKPYIKSNG